MTSKNQNLNSAELLKQKAEKKLGENQKNIATPITEIDVRRLVHELQVHQLQLEMLNEELMQANETAETTLKRYTLLFDFAPMGYFILDARGLICDLNFTGAELLLDKRFSLISANFKLFVSKASLPVFNQFFEDAFYGHTKATCEVIIENDKNLFRHVYMEGVVIEDEKECLLSVMDISPFKR